MPSDGRTFTESMVFTMVKYVLIAVFLLSALLMIALGISLVVYGVYALIEVSRFSEITGSILVFYGSVFIILGIIFSVVMNKCHPDTWIDMFLLVLLIFFVQQMVIGSRILATSFKKSNEIVLKRYLRILYDKAKGKEYFKDRIDRIHRTYECCGKDGPNDQQVRLSNVTLMDSCCKKLIKNVCTQEHAFPGGCWHHIAKVHASMFYSSASLAIAFGVLLGIVLLLAFYFKITYTRRPDYYVE